MDFNWNLFLLLTLTTWSPTNFVLTLPSNTKKETVPGLANSIGLSSDYGTESRIMNDGDDNSDIPATLVRTVKQLLNMKVNMGGTNRKHEVYREDCFTWDIVIERNPVPIDHVNYEKCLEKNFFNHSTCDEDTVEIVPETTTEEKPPEAPITLDVYDRSQTKSLMRYENQTYVVAIWLHLLVQTKVCVQNQESSLTRFPLRKGLINRIIMDNDGVCWKANVQIDPTEEAAEPKEVVDLPTPFVNAYFNTDLPPPLIPANVTDDYTWNINATTPGECTTQLRYVRDKSKRAWKIVVQVCGVGPNSANIEEVQNSYEQTIRLEKPYSSVKFVRDGNGLVWAVTVSLIEQVVNDASWPIMEDIDITIDFSKVDKSEVQPSPSLPSGETITFMDIAQPLAPELISNHSKVFNLVEVVSDKDNQPWEIRLTITEAGADRMADFQLTEEVMNITIDLEREGGMHSTLVDQNGTMYDLHISVTKCGLDCRPQQALSNNLVGITINFDDVRRILLPEEVKQRVKVIPVQKITENTVLETGKLKVNVVPNYPFPMPDMDGDVIWHLNSTLSTFKKTVQDDTGKKWKVELALIEAGTSITPDFNSADAILNITMTLDRPDETSKTVIDKSGNLWTLVIKVSVASEDEVVDVKSPSKKFVVELNLDRLRQQQHELEFEYVLVPPTNEVIELPKGFGDTPRRADFVAEKKGINWNVYVEVTRTYQPVPPFINVGSSMLKMKFELNEPVLQKATVVNAGLYYWKLLVMISRASKNAVATVHVDDDDFLYVHEDFNKLVKSVEKKIEVIDGIFKLVQVQIEKKAIRHGAQGRIERSMTVADKDGNLWDFVVIMNEMPYYQSPEGNVGNELKLNVTLEEEEHGKFVVAESSGQPWLVEVDLRRSEGGKPVLLTAKKNYFNLNLKFESRRYENGISWMSEQKISARRGKDRTDDKKETEKGASSAKN